MNKIFVGNLAWAVDDAKLKEIFSEFGNVTSANVITDRHSGRSKGFGFVEFETDEEAAKAKEGMNGKEIEGRELKIDEAKPRDDSAEGTGVTA